ncbi:unnamed protein product [Clonostachys rosea f. rosea IK726]|uniref:Uncharacterized protein n=2 Tax=Bionectria ochroleuca TaxID=29856 RepID=A0A0B7JUR4_BIOOC|nr:unnamed protein product [Clonostachys rosea f. rosea IK726]
MEEHAAHNGQQSQSQSQSSRTSHQQVAPSQRRFEGMPATDLHVSPGSPMINPESWVELSSQPSSSSLSSIGDDIVTTGLRVGAPYLRRRRLLASARSLPQQPTAIHSNDTSSQEEYEETESEDDHLMISSGERTRSSPEVIGSPRDESSDSESDGDNATALGRAPDRPAFRPQPNVFSHPHPQRSNSTSTAIPPHTHNEFTRPSFSQRSQTRASHQRLNFMSPSREDNDAALRASLTTLLSCAAAARGASKAKEELETPRTAGTGVGPSNQPMDLRFVPESELDRAQTEDVQPGVAPPLKPVPGARSSSRTGGTKTKRSTSAGQGPRTSRKKKVMVGEDALVSPTLMTWVVSAGVVVLVSVVGFGVGYVTGREVGRQEALAAAGMSTANDTSSCGQEMMRSSSGGLRRLKWGAVGKSLVASS